MGDWGPHNACQVGSGEPPTAEKDPDGSERREPTTGRPPIDLQPVVPLATRSQYVVTENASRPKSGQGSCALCPTYLTGVGPGLGRSSFLGTMSAWVGPGLPHPLPQTA